MQRNKSIAQRIAMQHIKPRFGKFLIVPIYQCEHSQTKTAPVGIQNRKKFRSAEYIC